MPPRCAIALRTILMLFALVACAAAPLRAQDSDPLRVALTGKYPPMSFFDEDGNLTGFDVEVAEEIARRLGREPEIVTTEWAGILAGLQAERYDTIIASMAITPERRQAVDFTQTYYLSGAQLFVREEDAGEISGMEDMDGRTVGASIGTTYQQHVEENFPDVTVQAYQGDTDIFQDMRSGRLDGFVTDRLVGMYNARKAGESFIPAGDLIYEERIAIPTLKKNSVLNAEIDRALTEMKTDGTLQNLQRKWFGLVSLENAETAAAAELEDANGVADSPPAGLIAGMLLWGFARTLLAAAIAIVLGFIIAIPFGVALNSAPLFLRKTLQFINDFVRGTPLLVQLLFVYSGIPAIGISLSEATGSDVWRDIFLISPMAAGIFTLTVNAAAYMAEVVRSGLLAVPPGQTIGAQALGLSKLQAFRFVVWPQAFRVMIPPLMNSIVALLKDTALLSVISVAEVITQAQKLIAITFEPMKFYGLVAILFFIVAYPLMKFSQRLEDRIRAKGYQQNA